MSLRETGHPYADLREILLDKGDQIGGMGKAVPGLDELRLALGRIAAQGEDILHPACGIIAEYLPCFRPV